MADFTKPFSGNSPTKMTLNELIRALRLDLAAEEDATTLYMAHADATGNPLAKKVLIDIANEERVHVGEFQELINILTQYEEREWLENGANEVREMAEEVARGDLATESPAEKAAKEEGEAPPSGGGNGRTPTIGSLKE